MKSAKRSNKRMSVLNPEKSIDDAMMDIFIYVMGFCYLK
jgi:hypothetical protein